VRFPALSDLDREQRKVYANAPSDGAILVIGPPGTGKTVMAFHRAQRMKELGQEPTVVMYNSVLRDYSSSRSGVAPSVPVFTMHRWVRSWWQRGRMGRLPTIGLNTYEPDWAVIADLVMDLPPDSNKIGLLDWGHLLVDEGQDFSESMYYAFGKVIRHLSKYGASPRLTVFADDNQRLHINTNCSVNDIAKNLRIAGDKSRNFLLSKNYRNTRPIAKFSQYFQVGRSSGSANLPDRLGEIPSVGFFGGDQELADFIVRKAQLSPGKQIGVVVQGNAGRVKRTYNQLEMRAKKFNITVQYYLHKDREIIRRLDFDSIGTITVLHQNSSKGLEFDLVFYVGLEQIDPRETGGLNERMAMYVMTSRARDELHLCFSDVDLKRPPPTGLRLMPSPDCNLCRFEAASSDASLLGAYLNQVEWQAPEMNAPYWEQAGT
jgi:DNA helicase-2/ATP-dependent DNA helicase PcrA